VPAATANLAVDAITRISDSLDLERIQIIKKPGGSLRESYLDEGFLLDKSIGVGQPKRIEGANIMVANTSMDTDKVKIFGSRVRVDSMAKVAEIEEAEKMKMRRKCQKIIDHGINVFINRQLIYNLPEQVRAKYAWCDCVVGAPVLRFALTCGGTLCRSLLMPV